MTSQAGRRGFEPRRPLLLKPSRDLDLEVPADVRQCGNKPLKNGTCTVFRVLEPYHASENVNQTSAFLSSPQGQELCRRHHKRQEPLPRPVRLAGKRSPRSSIGAVARSAPAEIAYVVRRADGILFYVCLALPVPNCRKTQALTQPARKAAAIRRHTGFREYRMTLLCYRMGKATNQ